MSANISRSEALEDYSLYSNLNDEELLQLAIERSLTDTPYNTCDRMTSKTAYKTPPQPNSSSLNPEARARNPSRHSSQNPHANYSSHNATSAQATANYSSPNPPREELPDLKTFDGTVSHFMTGSGKRMVEYRRTDGSLVVIAPEPELEEEPLFKAIRLGDASLVKALTMDLGTNLMLPSKPGWLAIHQAAWCGQDTCLRILLSAQPGMINKRTERGESALLVAVSRDQLESVQVLLENGVDPNIPNYEKETPLYRACERNIPAMVAALLNHGAVVNSPCIWGCTALHEASGQNNVEICEMLLKAGAKHNLTNMYGISPLFNAAQSGQLAALRVLLKHGTECG